jgi:Fe-Mn family superoxide dismutase
MRLGEGEGAADFLHCARLPISAGGRNHGHIRPKPKTLTRLTNMMTRRALLSAGLTAGAFTTFTGAAGQALAADPPPPPSGPFKLPPLPYAPDALEPHIDAQTMTIHHDKHHAAYVAKLNEAVAKWDRKPDGTVDGLKGLLGSLDGVREEARTAVRNHGGGHFNHTLFWESLSGKGGELKAGPLAKAIESSFKSRDAFLVQLVDSGTKVFGSGWVWLVHDQKKNALAITTTPNQDTPLAGGHVPLLGLDVWEHAYYLKYQNRRPDYLKAILNVIDWDVVSKRHEAALKV